jgi:peptide/nickel transport system substrate-binding protein
MKRLVRLLSIGAVFALLGSSLLPSFAQESNPAAGQGGTVVISNIGDDPKTFNPILSNDTSSNAVTTLLYPDIIGVDDRTLEDAPNSKNGLAESWEYDDTGTYLTVHLRKDMKWGDGTPVTADDYIWSFNAVRSGQTSSPRTYVFYQMEDGTVADGGVFDIKKIDDYTIEFHIGAAVKDEEGNWTGEVTPSCVALSDLNDIAVVPAHIFGPKFDSDLTAMDTDPYFVGTTAGNFKDPYLEFGVQVSLLADQSWPDAELGYVSPGEWIFRQVENSNVEYDRFLTGDFTYIPVSSNKQNEFRDIAEERGFQTIEYPGNGWTFMSYNLADPQNPQPGRDESGAHVDQGLHPIFTDVRVRQAIAHGVDVLAMIGTRPEGDTPGTGILQGNGYPVAVYNHPGLSWVDPGLEPYAFDQEKAGALLEEAGWTDEDGDGIRECHGCLYAESHPDFEGSPLKFSLLTNSGNVTREATGETVKTQLAEIGIQVDYQAIEFGALVDQFTAQTYDAIIIGWNLGLPFDPDGSSVLFGVGGDVPGSGFNTSSYYNEEYEKLLDEGKSLPGCDRAARTDIYKRTLEILYDEQPMLWLYATNTLYAAQPNVQSWDPLPYNVAWNLDAWTIGD